MRPASDSVRTRTSTRADALAGTVFTFFGFIHGEAIGLAKSPAVAASYLVVAAILYGCARSAAMPTGAPVRSPAAASGS